MGKKSKKGVSRAGTKARPKAGSGKSRTRSRSMDGYSQASSDNLHPNETLSVESMDAAPFVRTNNDFKGTAAAANNNNNLPPTDIQYQSKAPTSETEPKAAAPAVASPAPAPPTTPSSSAAAVAANPFAFPPAVTGTTKSGTAAPEPVVQPVVSPTTAAVVEPVEETKKEPTKKDVSKETSGKATAVQPPAAAVPPDTTIQSRGLALDQPAPEEAQTKQKDCECIIL
jgi:hypothetical protein